MIVAVCIDDNGGMLFNKRRQSRDKAVLEDLKNQGKKVWIHSFSEKLFSEYTGMVVVDDDFLKKAGEGDICFVENQSLKPYESQMEQIIVYKWNRKYPGDFRLDLDIHHWKLIEQVEFAGNSHEKITREVYSGRV